LLHAWLQQQVEGRHELAMRSQDLAELARAVREAQGRVVAAIVGVGAALALAVLYALR
jgi:ubiquinone biosynthesis protein